MATKSRRHKEKRTITKSFRTKSFEERNIVVLKSEITNHKSKIQNKFSAFTKKNYTFFAARIYSGYSFAGKVHSAKQTH